MQVVVLEEEEDQIVILRLELLVQQPKDRLEGIIIHRGLIVLVVVVVQELMVMMGVALEVMAVMD
jgi:hypothetical protein